MRVTGRLLRHLRRKRLASELEWLAIKDVMQGTVRGVHRYGDWLVLWGKFDAQLAKNFGKRGD